MKTLQISGEDLYINFETTYLSSVHDPAYSLAIEIKFPDGKKGKLILHSREELLRKEIGHCIYTFTATLITEELFPQLCTGIYCENKGIQETWITIVDQKFM